MSKFNPSEYGITIRQQLIDDHFFWVGRVAEFPDVEVFEESFSDAHDALLGILTSFNEAAERHGHLLPAPQPPQEENEEYSGRVTLRLTKSLHKKAALVARNEGVSLNQFLVATIAEVIGVKSSGPSLPVLVTHVINTQYAVATGIAQNQPFIVSGSIENFTSHSPSLN